MRLATILSASAVAAGLLAPTPALAITVDVEPTGLHDVFGLSRTGRYVLGAPLSKRARLIDLQTDQTLFRLPRNAAAPTLSASGRYVAYTVPVGKWGRHRVLVRDRVTGLTKDVTRRSNGKRLRPAWTGTCTQARCEEDQKLTYAPQLTGGQISGNGRYVVFSANFAVPGRIDVYLKNLRTGRLQRFTGAGRMFVQEGDAERIPAPSVSHNARTVLIPGRLDSYEAGDTWTAGRALFNRADLVDIGGVGNSMTRDGATITINGVFAGSSEGPPSEVAWYDVAIGTRVPATPAGLRLTLTNASSDGRYVVWKPDLASALRLRDRTAGLDHDLQAALTAAGYTVLASAGAPGGFMWGHIDRHAAISGDGRVLCITTDHGLVAVRWTP